MSCNGLWYGSRKRKRGEGRGKAHGDRHHHCRRMNGNTQPTALKGQDWRALAVSSQTTLRVLLYLRCYGMVPPLPGSRGGGPAQWRRNGRLPDVCFITRSLSVKHEESLLGHVSSVQSRRLLAELLLQTSDLGSSERVVVIGATNRIDDVDVALLRRFQSRVFVGPPTAAERVEMIESFMRGVEHELNRRQLETLSDRLLGWSGSDIKSLCREACMGPLRSWYEQEEELEKAVLRRQSEGGPLLRPVHMADFEKAYSFLMGSSSAVPSCERSPSSTRDEHMDGELDASMPAHEEGHHDSLCEPHVEATLSQEAKSTDGLDE